ncbi:aminopeptidase P N-terminal domain-containing protein [Opitutus sp. ER46]|uniref:aminopeptidase P N-terminal domain-containing protein n=1 Tax=Opitutus sp. ER46 TaxID=2161864 RepID=UPI000D32547C|nr:aminopeptidase P N-terminal domain-containing protein [Opitutus sp. ER46]PTX98504.1 hypothetical protein DB354_04365 [Opitutus sp. ER46]
MNTFLAERRARVGAALPLGDALLVVGSGVPVPLPEGSDQTYPFRAHSEYYYLAANEPVDAVVAFDPRDAAKGGRTDAGWELFVPEVTEGERVWEGRTQMPGRLRGEFAAWLQQRAGRPVVALGAPVAGVVANPALAENVRRAFTHARRPKDAGEIARLRRAAAATANGFNAMPGLLRAGVTERQLQIELEAGFFRGGGTRTGFGTIVGSGPNSAVLHFEPSDRAVRAGEFVLIDAGAEVDRYTADVTRTFFVGTPTGLQRDLYRLVLQAEENTIARCRPGAEWKDIHFAAARDMVMGLVEIGVMRGDPATLIEREAHFLFFPHGVGHMVGLGVRDGSGLAPGRTKDPRPSLKSLRMDLPLAPGYVVTAEPGLYFVPPLLNDPARRERYRDCINWALVDANLHIGGVRIEDDVLVTDGAPEVLTAAIPKAFTAVNA